MENQQNQKVNGTLSQSSPENYIHTDYERTFTLVVGCVNKIGIDSFFFTLINLIS